LPVPINPLKEFPFMSQHFRVTSASTTLGILIALGVGCGHSETPPGGSGAGATGGTGNTVGGGAGTNPAGGAGGAGATAGTSPSGGSGNVATGGANPTGGAGGAGATAGVGATAGAGATAGDSSSGGSAGTTVVTSCTDTDDQWFDDKTMPGNAYTADPMVDQVLGAMSQEQKILQMSGIPVGNKDYQDIERSPDVDVGGTTIRGYRYRDAGHGVNLDAGQDNRPNDGNNFATAFPQQSTRGASWDLELEWALGEAMGDETAASKNNMLLGPCMNIIRHPYWGRTQEVYGEDTYHMGRMATAWTAGLQQHVAACAKHYAANNVEQNRANQDALMDEQTLREIYGRHFEMVVEDGGVSCIMAAYNKINGKKSTQNQHLLTTILRTDFGFKGTVISDWWAMPGDQGPIDTSTAIAQAGEAALAGLDIEVPWTLNYGQLGAAISANPAVGTAVNESARRILQEKFRFKSALSTDGWSAKGDANLRSTLSGGSIATNQGHLDLAELSAVKSAVLLKNGAAGAPVLPITGTPSIAVVGLDLPININSSTTMPKSGPTFQMANHVAVGDRGSSRVNADPAHSVGPADGITQIGALHGVTNVTSGNSAAAAGSADLVVVVVGLTPGDEGEEYAIDAGGDRASLNLPGQQNQLVESVLALNKPTVIIVQSGSIVNLPWLGHANQNQATIWAGYAGMRAGLAYGKLLFAHEGANFSGKMPLAWPLEADLITFKDMPNSTTMGYFFGYRHYDKRAADGNPAALVFPFGHGLSYSTFTYGNLMVPCTTATEKAILNVTVDITNTTDRAGEEVALLFVKGPAPAGTGARAVKELKSFAKVAVPAMGTVTANLPLRIQDLRHWEGDANGSWVIDKGEYTVLVGKSGADADLTLTGTFTIN
jgi:beta-glucosidase